MVSKLRLFGEKVERNLVHWSFWALVHGIKKPLCKTSLGEDPRYVHKYVYMSIV
jgi:hypothetical protein